MWASLVAKDLFFLFWLVGFKDYTIYLIAFLAIVGHWLINAVILIVRRYRNSKLGRDFIRFALFVPVGGVLWVVFFIAISRYYLLEYL